jgi:hypothetical protein
VTGAQGPQGAQGAQGPQGENSATPGSQGAQGQVGELPGAQGASNATTGAQGATPGAGPQGAQGAQGSEGIKGPQGAQGAQGAQGPTGPTGPPSDYRLKTNVIPLTNVTSKVIDMRGVKFEWLENIPQLEHIPEAQHFYLKGKSIGFIAQEIEKIFPELVLEDRYGYKNIQYDILVAIGVAAVKENNERIILLKNKIKPLKSFIGG